MNKSTRAENAANKYRNPYNCCQSVLCALSDINGFEEKQILTIGAGFLAGMGDMSGTCGALIGAVISAGVAADGNRTIMCAREIVDKFREKSGDTICRRLKGIDRGEVLCPCEECISNAIESFCEVMNIE